MAYLDPSMNSPRLFCQNHSFWIPVTDENSVSDLKEYKDRLRVTNFS